MRTRPVEVVRRRPGVERSGGARHRDAEGVDLGGAPGSRGARRRGARSSGRKPSCSRPVDVAQGDQEPVLVAEAAVDAVDQEVEGQVREGRGVEDEGWLGSHGTSGTARGCPAIGPRGRRDREPHRPVGGARDRIEPGRLRARLAGIRRRRIIPRAGPCRTVPDAPRHHDRTTRRRQPAPGRRAQGPAGPRAGGLHGPRPRGARRPPGRPAPVRPTGRDHRHRPRHRAPAAPPRRADRPVPRESGSTTRRPTAPRWPRSSTSSGSSPTGRPTRPLPIHNQLAKLLGRLSQRAHEVVELIWSSSGAMNEHLAMSAYREMGIVAEQLGERPLYETLFKRLRTHEAAHKGFYAAYAREVAHGHAPRGSAGWPGRSSSTRTRRSVPARRSTSPRSAAPCGPSTPTAAGSTRSPTRSSASPRSCSPTASPCRGSSATRWPSASRAWRAQLTLRSPPGGAARP